MILRLKTGCRIEYNSPILGTQNLIHPQKRVPDGTKRHLVLVPKKIHRRNVPSHQLTSQYCNEKCNHEQEHDQVQETIDIAKDFAL